MVACLSHRAAYEAISYIFKGNCISYSDAYVAVCYKIYQQAGSFVSVPFYYVS
jgi:hypothetical protein